MKIYPLARVAYTATNVARTLFVLVIGVNLISLGLDANLKSDHWAAWVGAVGTIGTLIGTIWLATAETRRRQRHDQFIARLHIEANVPRLMHAGQTLADVSRLFARAKHDGGFADHLGKCKHALATIYPWKIDELIPLAGAPVDIAQKLAQGLAELQAAKTMIDSVLSTYEQTGAEPSIETIFGIYPWLVNAGTRINEACHMCLGIPFDMCH